MEKFAKLFEVENTQVVVLRKDDNKGNPEVRCYFQPKGLGVCEIAFGGWEDCDEGHKKADSCFKKCDDEFVSSKIRDIIKNFGMEDE